jgi:hypothetical protein
MCVNAFSHILCNLLMLITGFVFTHIPVSYKAFLDIKNPGYREYKGDGINEPATPSLKTINPALVPSYCDKHANQYALYLIDSRAAVNALAGEPRFLSIAPDNGLSDLESEYTSDSVKVSCA